MPSSGSSNQPAEAAPGVLDRAKPLASRPEPVVDPSNPDMSAAEAEAASLRLAAELQAKERRTSGRRRRQISRSVDVQAGQSSLAGSTNDARSVSTAGTRPESSDIAAASLAASIEAI